MAKKHATVRMPHLGEEAHLWRTQRKVLRKSQPGLEDSSFAVVRGKIRSDKTQGSQEPSLECVVRSGRISDGETTGKEHEW